tara:strand:- start:1877 stop:2062 length:186 start_codon:yes stop_codon:yes gene_type:complete
MIERTIKGNKKQISLYLNVKQLTLLDKEAKDNELSRNKLLQKIIDYHYPIGNKIDQKNTSQ